MSSPNNRRQREGRCDRCQILWVWSMNQPLKNQTCAECGGPLKRVTERIRQAGSGYLAMVLETYYAPLKKAISA